MTHSAQLNATSTNAVGGVASFNLGIDTNYGTVIQAGTVEVDIFSAIADGLLPVTEYHYQAVVVVDGITYTGEDVTFTTLADVVIPTVTTLPATEIS